MLMSCYEEDLWYIWENLGSDTLCNGKTWYHLKEKGKSQSHDQGRKYNQRN